MNWQQYMESLSPGDIGKILDDYDRERGFPCGCSRRNAALSERYEIELTFAHMLNPDATKIDVRHSILPMIVDEIYKDWSPQKQEFLVHNGYKAWFHERGFPPS